MTKQGLCAAGLAATIALGSGVSHAETTPAKGIAQQWAETVSAQIELAAVRIGKLLRTARATHEETRIACANEGLARANAAHRHAKADGLDAKAAEARGDGNALRIAMQRLTVDRDAAKRAATDVEACFQIDKSGDDKTVVKLVVDQDVAH